MRWEKVKKFFGDLTLDYQEIPEPGRSQEAYLDERRKREGGWINFLIAGLSVIYTRESIAAGKEQRKAIARAEAANKKELARLAKERKELKAKEAKKEKEAKAAAERLKREEEQAKRPLTEAIEGAKIAAAARDPFMEAAVQEGTFQQTAAATRRAELAAGGVGAGGRVRSAARTQAGAAAQGLLSRESMRIQRNRELNQAISSGASQLANISMTGMRTREQSSQYYQQRADAYYGAQSQLGGQQWQVRQQLLNLDRERSQIPSFAGQFSRGALGFMAAGGHLDDMFSGLGGGQSRVEKMDPYGYYERQQMSPSYGRYSQFDPDSWWR